MESRAAAPSGDSTPSRVASPLFRARPRATALDTRLLTYGIAGVAPAVLLATALAIRSDLRPKDGFALVVLVTLTAIGFALAARAHVTRSLRTIENLVGAVREGDYSFRARHDGGDDALAGAMRELNLLGATLREQRTDAIEASALVDRVKDSIDVALFAFDDEGALRLVNPAGSRLLGRPAAVLLGAHANDLGLENLLDGEAPRTVVLELGAGHGRFELRRATFRLRGLPHRLVVLADLERALREEERVAWQRLVRVLGHEINNSLAPIHSIASQMHDALRAETRAPDLDEDLTSGLGVIARRSAALQRFLTAYAKLTRLPKPTLGPVDVGEWVRRTAKLEARMPVEIRSGPAATLQADADQLDQLLINLVRNAVDAALETGGGVALGWTLRAGVVEIQVLDEGPGIAGTQNLFVPFFTTKPAGSGIGLVLARQIAEAHGGSLTLEPRENTANGGSIARVRLPSS